MSDAPGPLCLQGGNEFTAPCLEMDAIVVDRARARHAERPVAVLAGAARPGSDYRGASARARRHYESLGVERVVVVPDPRDDPDAAIASLSHDIGLLVLPGGSPASLADVLLGTTPEVGDRVLDLHDDGMGISGASAGAMLLADYAVLPEHSRRRRTTVTEGLGLVEGIVLPHWSDGDIRWPLPDEIHLWGLPECGGVLIGGDGATEAVGRGAPGFRVAGGGWVPVIRATRQPTPEHPTVVPPTVS